MAVCDPPAPNENKRRRRVVVALALITVGVLAAASLAGRRQSTGWQPLEEFGFSFKEVVPVFPPLTPKWRTVQFQISRVSQDGRWIFISQSKTIGDGWLFDLENRRFVGQLSPSPSLKGPWDMRHVPIEKMKRNESFIDYHAGYHLYRITRGRYEPVRHGMSFYVADIPSGRAKRLMYDGDRARCGCSFSGFRFMFSPDYSRAGYAVLLTGHIQCAVCWDLQKEKRRAVRADSIHNHRDNFVAVWRWLPDSRTLVLCEGSRNTSGSTTFSSVPLKNIHLFDTACDEKPHKISISEALTRLRLEGRLHAAEQSILHAWPLVAVDSGRRLRLFITFFCDAQWNDATADRSSIWDLDLKTGNLTRVMDLALAPAYLGNILCSPSGATVITSLAPATIAADEKPWPTQLVVHNRQKPPQHLPFKIPLPGTSRYHERLYRKLDDRIRFRDDDTLIYTQPGFELWQFDLRTWKSELLWRPEATPQRKEE